MTARTQSVTEQLDEALAYIGAVKLALVASADIEAGYRLVDWLMERAPDPDGKSTLSTKLLIDGIRDLGATVSVP